MKHILQALLAAFVLAASSANAGTPATDGTRTVVFVCEHGSVKSLMASEYFNRAASERGLPFRAVARGIQPEERVPGRIVERLREDGFDASGFRPQAVAATDVAGAARVVAIGIDVSALPPQAEPQQWNDVPPASVDYAAARERIQQHVHALLDELAAADPQP